MTSYRRRRTQHSEITSIRDYCTVLLLYSVSVIFVLVRKYAAAGYNYRVIIPGMICIGVITYEIGKLTDGRHVALKATPPL